MIPLALALGSALCAHPLIKQPLSLDYASKLIGTPAPDWDAEGTWDARRWDGAAPMTLASLRGRVVFVRFWMDSCPFCRASLPAFEQLTKTFEGRRVTFIGMYHSKPFGSERPWAAAVKTARSWGATFPLAYDHMWRTLKTWYGDLLKRAPTSVSFVIDHEGRFSFVHPGPVFHPSKSPDHARCDQDYQAIKKAIWAALEKAERIDH